MDCIAQTSIARVSISSRNRDRQTELVIADYPALMERAQRLCVYVALPVALEAPAAEMAFASYHVHCSDGLSVVGYDADAQLSGDDLETWLAAIADDVRALVGDDTPTDPDPENGMSYIEVDMSPDTPIEDVLAYIREHAIGGGSQQFDVGMQRGPALIEVRRSAEASLLYRRWLQSLDPRYPEQWGSEMLEQAYELRQAIIDHAAANPLDWSRDWIERNIIHERDALAALIALPVTGGSQNASGAARERRISAAQAMVAQAEHRVAAVERNSSLKTNHFRDWSAALNDASQARNSARFLKSACTLTDSPLACGFAEEHQLVEAVQELEAVCVELPLPISEYLLELGVLQALPRSRRHKRFRVTWTYAGESHDIGFVTISEARAYARNITACWVTDYASIQDQPRGITPMLVDTYHAGRPLTRSETAAWS